MILLLLIILYVYLMMVPIYLHPATGTFTSFDFSLCSPSTDWVKFDHLCKEKLTDTIELYDKPIDLFTNVLCNIFKRGQTILPPPPHTHF